jgi:hypothetical protein
MRAVAGFAILLACSPLPLCAQEGTASLTGSVLLAQVNGGEAIPGGSVTLESVAGGARQETKSDERGVFRFSGLRTGKYLLSLRALGFDGVKVKLDLLAGEQKSLPPIGLNLAPSGCGFSSDTEPERTRFLYTGPSLGGLAGSVKADLGPAVGAQVVLSCWTTLRCSGPDAAVTDAQGNFEFEVYPGRYVLRIAQDKFFPSSGMQFVIVGGLESSYSFNLTSCPNGDCTVKPSQSNVKPTVCE